MADPGLWVGSDGVFGDAALRRSQDRPRAQLICDAVIAETVLNTVPAFAVPPVLIIPYRFTSPACSNAPLGLCHHSR